MSFAELPVFCRLCYSGPLFLLKPETKKMNTKYSRSPSRLLLFADATRFNNLQSNFCNCLLRSTLPTIVTVADLKVIVSIMQMEQSFSVRPQASLVTWDLSWPLQLQMLRLTMNFKKFSVWTCYTSYKDEQNYFTPIPTSLVKTNNENKLHNFVLGFFWSP